MKVLTLKLMVTQLLTQQVILLFHTVKQKKQNKRNNNAVSGSNSNQDGYAQGNTQKHPQLRFSQFFKENHVSGFLSDSSWLREIDKSCSNENQARDV